MSEVNQPEADSKRERIAFGREIDWEEEGYLGTIYFGPESAHQFPPLLIGTVETLFENGYIDPKQSHNDAPPAVRLKEWAATVQQRFKNDQIRVGLVGYMISPSREDTRIALTGVSIQSPTELPEQIKSEVARNFNPDLIAVDDFEIEIVWD